MGRGKTCHTPQVLRSAITRLGIAAPTSRGSRKNGARHFVMERSPARRESMDPDASEIRRLEKLLGECPNPGRDGGMLSLVDSILTNGRGSGRAKEPKVEHEHKMPRQQQKAPCWRTSIDCLLGCVGESTLEHLTQELQLQFKGIVESDVRKAVDFFCEQVFERCIRTGATSTTASYVALACAASDLISGEIGISFLRKVSLIIHKRHQNELGSVRTAVVAVACAFNFEFIHGSVLAGIIGHILRTAGPTDDASSNTYAIKGRSFQAQLAASDVDLLKLLLELAGPRLRSSFPCDFRDAVEAIQLRFPMEARHPKLDVRRKATDSPLMFEIQKLRDNRATPSKVYYSEILPLRDWLHGGPCFAAIRGDRTIARDWGFLVIGPCAGDTVTELPERPTTADDSAVSQKAEELGFTSEVQKATFAALAAASGVSSAVRTVAQLKISKLQRADVAAVCIRCLLCGSRYNPFFQDVAVGLCRLPGDHGKRWRHAVKWNIGSNMASTLRLPKESIGRLGRVLGHLIGRNALDMRVVSSMRSIEEKNLELLLAELRLEFSRFGNPVEIENEITKLKSGKSVGRFDNRIRNSPE